MMVRQVVRDLQRSPHAGFTLIELMVTLVIAVVLLTIAIPSFSNMMTRQRLRAAAEQVRADLDLARTEAIKRNAAVRISFTRDLDGSWCYGLTLNADDGCDCAAASGTDICFLDVDGSSNPLRRAVSGEQYRGVTMAAGVGDIVFRPVRPVIRNESIALTAAGRTATVITHAMGRIRLCSPAGDNYLSYYDAC